MRNTLSMPRHKWVRRKRMGANSNQKKGGLLSSYRSWFQSRDISRSKQVISGPGPSSPGGHDNFVCIWQLSFNINEAWWSRRSTHYMGRFSASLQTTDGMRVQRLCEDTEDWKTVWITWPSWCLCTTSPCDSRVLFSNTCENLTRPNHILHHTVSVPSGVKWFLSLLIRRETN